MFKIGYITSGVYSYCNVFLAIIFDSSTSHFFFSHLSRSAVFTWTNLLVVVVELDADESEALDVVPLVTSSVLNEQQLIVGVVVVVDPGVVPINSRGEKQRMHLRDGFLADQLDPIYVAYNM